MGYFKENGWSRMKDKKTYSHVLYAHQLKTSWGINRPGGDGPVHWFVDVWDTKITILLIFLNAHWITANLLNSIIIIWRLSLRTSQSLLAYAICIGNTHNTLNINLMNSIKCYKLKLMIYKNTTYASHVIALYFPCVIKHNDWRWQLY